MSAFMRVKASAPSTSISSAITETDNGRRSAKLTIHISGPFENRRPKSTLGFVADAHDR